MAVALGVDMDAVGGPTAKEIKRAMAKRSELELTPAEDDAMEQELEAAYARQWPKDAVDCEKCGERAVIKMDGLMTCLNCTGMGQIVGPLTPVEGVDK